MAMYYINTYDLAKNYLSQGRKSWDRPLYNTRGMRLQYRGADTIAVQDSWGSFDPILFHKDGTLTIQSPTQTSTWGSSYNALRSQGIRYAIRRFAGLKDLYQHASKIHLITQDAMRAPAKFQKCRKCSGTGLVDSWCSFQMCYIEDCEQAKQPNNKNNGFSGWHAHPCEHGNINGHTILAGRICTNQCVKGQKDYGSKLISIIWDGSPLRLKDGNLVKQSPTELEKRIAAYVQL